MPETDRKLLIDERKTLQAEKKNYGDEAKKEQERMNKTLTNQVTLAVPNTHQKRAKSDAKSNVKA